MKQIKSWLKRIMLLIVAFTFFSLEYVNAEETVIQKDICFPNGSGLYQVSWDTTKATEVTLEKIQNDEQAVKDGHLPYPEGTSEADKVKYNFDSTLRAGTCYIQGTEVKACPSDSDDDFFSSETVANLLAIKNKEEGYKNVSFELNPSTKKVKVKITDVYEGRAQIRLVGSGDTPNNGYTKANSSMNFLTKEDGYFIINNVSPSMQKNNVVNLEVYTVNGANDPCNGTFLYKISLTIDSLYDMKVNNPAYYNPNQYCSGIIEHINKMKASKINYGDIDGIKKKFSPTCFVDEKITYGKYEKLTSTIKNEENTIKKLFPLEISEGGYSPITTSGLECDRDIRKNYTEQFKLVSSYTGEYWAATCYENYSLNYDNAKLVRAGAGFTYEADFKSNRYCYLSQLKIVEELPLCTCDCGASCTSPNGEAWDHAGPNSSFDSCVNECDGGNYTQSCINSCYNKVYSEKKERNLSKLDELLNKSQKFMDRQQNIIRTNGNVNPWEDVPNTCKHKGQDIYECTYSCCGKVVSVEIAVGCQAAGASCSVYISKTPQPCADTKEDQDRIYKEDIAKSKADLQEAENLMNSEIRTGEYEILIADSYLTNDKGDASVYNVDNKVLIKNDTGSKDSCTGGMVNYKLGSKGDSKTACSRVDSYRKVDVQLTDAYLNKADGTAIYKKTDGYYWFNQNPKADKSFLSLYAKNISNRFYKAGNRYYTNVLSYNTNVVIPKDSTKQITLVDDKDYFKQTQKKATISVSVKNMGTISNITDSNDNGFTKDLSCYYGVYNDTICRDNDECPPTCVGAHCNSDPTPTDTKGIQFIFRPIELTDVFPNDRNPRWNWTTGASVISNDSRYNLLGYKISPETLTGKIEKDGYDIYSKPEEVDYEFNLTANDLVAIRKYNDKITDINKDGSKNYLDYDMSCSKDKNGRDYCYSKFLDKYITSYGNGFSKITRQDIAVCNNTWDKQCVSY